MFKFIKSSSLLRVCASSNSSLFPLSVSRYNSQIIVKSKFSTPDLESELATWPLVKLVTKDFLKPDRKDQLAMIDGFTHQSITYQQLYYQIYSFADSLKALHYSKGQVLALISPNHILYSTIYLGANLMGMITSCLNPMQTESELIYQLQEIDVDVIVCHPSVYSKIQSIVQQSFSQKKIQIILLNNQNEDATIPKEAGRDGQNGDVKGHPSIKPYIPITTMIQATSFTPKYNHLETLLQNFDIHSIVTIPFSSGTTGKSKGVMLTHKNLISNMFQRVFIEGPVLTSPTSNKTLLVPLPFYHIYGQTAGLLFAHYVGAKLIFMPSFDFPTFLQLIEKYLIQRIYVVPPIVLLLTKHSMVSQYNLTSLRCLMSGGASLSKELQIACAKRLNCLVKQGWGMTETSPTGTITPDHLITSIEELNGTCGVLAPNTEGKIVDTKTGEDLPYDQLGEFMIRGPQVMKGYLKNEHATKMTIQSDGWLHTGDLGYFDANGWLYLIGRKKELIKYKGYQVPPAELEAILATIPWVKDVMVIPIAVEEVGEIPRAYIVKQDDMIPSEILSNNIQEYILQYVHQQVAYYKKLRGGIIFIDMIPKSPSGKLLRNELIAYDRKHHPYVDHKHHHSHHHKQHHHNMNHHNHNHQTHKYIK